MAIHKAGPRLYRSVPFKHLAKGGAHGTARSSNVALNLTPFVDMMTILVTFLLIVFLDQRRADQGPEEPGAAEGREQGEAAGGADHHDHAL
jgi:hypothetical protein